MHFSISTDCWFQLYDQSQMKSPYTSSSSKFPRKKTFFTSNCYSAHPEWSTKDIISEQLSSLSLEQMFLHNKFYMFQCTLLSLVWHYNDQKCHLICVSQYRFICNQLTSYLFVSYQSPKSYFFQVFSFPRP